MAEVGSFARRDHRKGVLLAVLLGHGALLGLLAHDAGRRSAARWWLAPSQAAAPSEPSPPLVVRLLPLPSDAPPHATAQGRTISRAAPTPSTRSTLTQLPQQAQRPETPVAVGGAAPSEPPATAAQPGLRIDDQTLRQAAADAEAGTVRALAKAAGRLDGLERPRTPPLVVAMGAAAPPNLQEQIRARIAKDNACKQELGKSGVGERNVHNDRDTFMPSYIGAGRECKK